MKLGSMQEYAFYIPCENFMNGMRNNTFIAADAIFDFFRDASDKMGIRLSFGAGEQNSYWAYPRATKAFGVCTVE